MKALSDGTRLKIIWLLCNIDSKICSSEIAEVLGENRYNISRHIKVLKNAGLIYEKREGSRIFYYYRLERAEFNAAVRQLVKNLPAEMMVEEVNRCRKCLERRENCTP